MSMPERLSSQHALAPAPALTYRASGARRMPIAAAIGSATSAERGGDDHQQRLVALHHAPAGAQRPATGSDPVNVPNGCS